MSISTDLPDLQVSRDPTSNNLEGNQMNADANPRLLAPFDARLYQSCPASLHASPVPAQRGLSELNLDLDGWNAYFGQDMLTSNKPAPALGVRIATPAAPNPFGGSQEQGTGQDTYQNPNEVSDGPRWSGRETDYRTIDPRWVSPLSSLWPTPAATPRTQSPILGQGQGQGQGQNQLPLFHQSAPMQHVEPLPFPALIPPREVLGMGTQSYPPRLVERRAMGMEMPELTLPDLGPLAGGSEFGLAGGDGRS